MSNELRKLDLEVVEHVFGCNPLLARIDPMNRDGEPQFYWGYPAGHDFAPFYSSSIEAAMRVVEKMRADGWSFACTLYEGELPYASFCKKTVATSRKAEANILPEAICRAALEAVKSDVKEQSDTQAK